MTETGDERAYGGLTRHEPEKGFEYWLTRPYLGGELRSTLADKAVLLVPQEGFRESQDPVFPVGTEEFFRFLKDGLPQDAVDVVVEEANYKELALHFDWLVLGGMIVTAGVAPVVTTLIAEYVKRRIWPEASKAEDRKVRVEVVVEDREQNRRAGIRYEGPAHELEASLRTAVDELRSEGVIDVEAKALPAGDDGDSGRS